MFTLTCHIVEVLGIWVRYLEPSAYWSNPLCVHLFHGKQISLLLSRNGSVQTRKSEVTQLNYVAKFLCLFLITRVGMSYTIYQHTNHHDTYTSEFESHWVLLSYGLVPHLSKKLSKFPLIITTQLTKAVNSYWLNCFGHVIYVSQASMYQNCSKTLDLLL